MQLTPAQQAALADVASFGLKFFRRGYARDNQGPFHGRQTIQRLSTEGLVVISPQGRSVRLAQQSARD